MRGGKVIAVTLGLAGIVLIVSLIFRLRCPISVKLVNLEPAGMVDYAGAQLRVATLNVDNRDSGGLEFRKNKTFEARVGNRWIEVDQPFYVDWLPPACQTELLLLMPAGSDACRVRFSYQRELFKWRLWRCLGSIGQRALGRFPSLYSALRPQGQSSRSTGPYKEAMLEVDFAKAAIAR